MGNVIQFPSNKVKKPVETSSEPVTFKGFAMEMLADDIPAASKSLEFLFGVEHTLAKRCAEFFHKKLQTDSELLMKTMDIRMHLESKEMEKALEKIGECFGVFGLEAVRVLGGMMDKMGTAATNAP